MQPADSQSQRIPAQFETIFSQLLNALENKSIAVGRDQQHASTLYMSPKSANEVMEVVKLCSRTHTPISLCYGTQGTVSPEPRVYLDLQRLDIITPLSESRYLVGLGASVSQLRATPLQALVPDDDVDRYADQCLGQLLLSQASSQIRHIEQSVVGLVAVLPDGQLWSSLNNQQQCASERLLNALFVSEAEAALSVLIALELESNPDKWFVKAPVFGDVDALPNSSGASTQHVISKLKEALDPNRILNGAKPSVQASNSRGVL